MTSSLLFEGFGTPANCAGRKEELLQPPPPKPEPL